MAILNPFTQANKKAVIALSGIFATRMLGMFLLLPVLALSSNELAGASPMLMGVALGVYGLCQAALQIPFGLLSDHYGRKPVMTLGLTLFLLGSLVAAFSSSIFGIILGRALQGAGAIGSTTLAFIADLTPEDKRSQAMAIVGINIAASFGVAMLFSAPLFEATGIHGIFMTTAALACLSLILLHTLIPTPQREYFHRDTSVMTSSIKDTLKSTELKRLDFGIFTLHLTLGACFLVLPTIIASWEGITATTIYAPALLGALPSMLLGTYFGEKNRKIKEMLIFCVAAIFGTLIYMQSTALTPTHLTIALLIFFSAFGLCEAFLPSLVSKLSPSHTKGTAIGLFSTAQFLGVFAGGYLGGLTLSSYGQSGLFLMCASLCLIWLILTIRMKQPPYLSSQMFDVKIHDNVTSKKLQQHLLSQPGIHQAEIVSDDGIAYLKFDSKITTLDKIVVAISEWQNKTKTK